MTEWRKSSYTGTGNDDVCVEVARLNAQVGVRDSKNREGGHLGFSLPQFADLLTQIKRGDMEVP